VERIARPSQVERARGRHQVSARGNESNPICPDVRDEKARMKQVPTRPNAE